MNAKSRTILLITLILVIFSVTILIVMKMQHEQEMKMSTDKYFKNLQVSYNNIRNKYNNYYDDVIVSVFSQKDLKKALKDKDKTLTYQLSINKYIALKKQNKNLLNMKFYTPDNKLLLNMNTKSNIISKGGVFVQDVHRTKKALFSAYVDGDDVVFKSIHPIFYADEYIACVELDISAKYILDDMKKYINIDGFMFSVKSEALYYNTMQNMLLLSSVPKGSMHNTQKEVQTRKGSIYSAYTFVIRDRVGVNISTLYFFNDITQELTTSKNNLYLISIFLVAMVFVSIIIVSIGVSKSLKKLDSSFDDLYEYTDMIDSNIMIVDTDKDGIIIGASKRFCEVSGFKQDELIEQSFQTLKKDSVDKKVYEDIQKSLQKDKKWSGDLQNIDKNGQTYWLSVNIEEKTKDKKFVCYNYIMHNITDKKTNEELVLIDELTSLYNRKYFNDTFPRMVNGIKRNGGCINFAVVDLDNFSRYNEEYGSKKADEALILVSEKLTDSLRRPDDYCFRLGGGEFGVLYRSASEEEGYMYAKVLKKNIELLGIKDKTNMKFKVITASLGLSSFMDKDIVSSEDIYKIAYTHLRRAKDDGKNKVVYKLI